MSETKFHYINGDATNPEGNGLKIIAHICNDIGGYCNYYIFLID